MKIINKNRIKYIPIAIAILFFDQFIKYFISTNYKNYLNKDFFLFSIDYVKNYGAAFNIFSGSRVFLSLVSIFISTLLLYIILFKHANKRVELYGYTLILGGSVGNGIDRLINGYVIDFIKFNYINFPVFNIADVAINIGFLIIIYSFFILKK